MVGVGAEQLQLSFQRYTIRESALQTLCYGVARRVDIVIQKLQHEIVPGICYGEVLGEHLIKPLVLARLGGCVQLEKITERFELHLKEIRIWERILDCAKIYTRFIGCFD